MTQPGTAFRNQSPACAAHDLWNWSRGGRAAWWLSLTLHAVTFVAIGASSQRDPQGAALEPTREGGIVLVARSSDKAEYIGDPTSADAKADADVETPPALFPGAAQQPIVAAPQLPVGDIAAAIGTAADSSFTAPSVTPASYQAAPGTRVPSHGVETQVFGVKGKGSRFVYVFDRSSSMEGGPLLAAKRELIASLQSLQGNHQFQIIFYNEQPHLMPDFRGRASAMVFANEPGKRLAANFVGGVSAHGSTDHLRALRTALEMRPDVIFLLTDASEPQLSAAELIAIRRLNQRTTISAIEFGLG